MNVLMVILVVASMTTTLHYICVFRQKVLCLKTQIAIFVRPRKPKVATKTITIATLPREPLLENITLVKLLVKHKSIRRKDAKVM